MYARKKHVIIIGIACLLFLVGSAIGWQVIHQAILPILLVVIVGLLLAILSENRGGVQFQLQESWKSYGQIESLFYLYSTLRVRHPLPPMRGWAISPDFANIVISCIRESKPKLVLEAGSGVSTLVIAYCLQEIGEGVVVSLDHNEQYSALTAANVAKHQLQDTATVIYARLKEVAIHDKNWLWYDTEYLRNMGPIDMLVIDGPPAATQKLARYPALPVLFHLLSDDAIILLDDAFRPDEKEIVKLWLEEFGDFSLEEINAEKGAAILRRRAAFPKSTYEKAGVLEKNLLPSIYRK
jgi:predicted O-methyltransferase YrrM